MTHSNAPLVLSTREPHPITPAAVPDRIERYRSETELDIELANHLSTSDMLPGAYKGKHPDTVRANLTMVFALGRALGVERVSALYAFHVIENTPSPSAKLQAALVRRAGHHVRMIRRTDTEAVVEIVRHDDPTFPCRVEYTLDDARRAGALDIWVDRWTKNSEGRNKREQWTFPASLSIDATEADLRAAGAPDWAAKAPFGDRKRRDPWHQRPRAMLWHRAITECVGAACPEVLAGLDFDGGFDPGPIVDTTTADPLDVLRARPEEPEPEPEDIADAELVDEPEEDLSAVPYPEPDVPLTLLGEADPHDGFPPDAPKVDESELKAAMKAAGVTQAATMRQFEAQAFADLLAPELIGRVMEWLEGDR